MELPQTKLRRWFRAKRRQYVLGDEAAVDPKEWVVARVMLLRPNTVNYLALVEKDDELLPVLPPQSRTWTLTYVHI